MIGNFFESAAAKIFGISSLVLLIAVGVLGFKLAAANNTIEKRDLQIKAVSAERDRFKDALAFFVNDGQIRIGRGQAALKEHEGVSADLQRQADKIRTRVVTVRENCPTPAEVMGAPGL